MTKPVMYPLLLLCAVLLFIPARAESAAPAVEEIVNRSNSMSFYTGNDMKADAVMIITDKEGRKKRRELVILRKDTEDGGRQKLFLYFKNPPDVHKIAYLVHKNVEKDDDRWLYLPSLDIVKKIAFSNKRTSFLGSHYYYEDISGRSLLEDTHALVRTTDNFYILINVPKDPKKVEFTSYKTWVDRETFVPLKTEFIDKKGGAYRVFEALEVRDVQGYPTIVRSRIKDLVNGGETMFVLKDVAYDLGLGDVFSKDGLKSPSAEVTD